MIKDEEISNSSYNAEIFEYDETRGLIRISRGKVDKHDAVWNLFNPSGDEGMNYTQWHRYTFMRTV